MTMDLANIVIAGLAVWRLARLLAVESGPFGILEKLRTFWYGDHWCIHCLGIWIAPVFFVLFWNPIGWMFVCMLAIAGVSSLIRETLGH